MILAQRHHQSMVIDLISNAFSRDPQFLAYTQGKQARVRLIIKLAFETCIATHTIYLSDDLQAVALCKPASRSGFNIRALLINMQFPFIFGITSLRNLLRIESAIENKRQTCENCLYIWMLATHTKAQGKGIGSQLLNDIHALCEKNNAPILLETSKASNVQYYAKRGYTLYDELNSAPNLTIYLMKKTF